MKLISEFANAITMLPFIFLSLYTPNVYQSILITCMWISAFLNHWFLHINRKKESNFYLLLDCCFQIGSLAILPFAASCIKMNRHMRGTFVSICFAFILCIIGLFFLDKTDLIIQIVSIAHIANAIYGYMYVCNYQYYSLSMVFLFLTGILYFSKSALAWAIAHVCLFLYILFFWKALSI